MNRDEFKFLIVNTSSLWQKQKGEIMVDIEGKDSIEITQEGLSLRKYYTHVLTESYPLGKCSFADFALAYPGVLYILDSKEKRLVIFDTSTGTYERIENISFSKPEALAVDSSNIYVADDDRIYCLARSNQQTRWEVYIEGMKAADMALDNRQNLHILDRNSLQVYKINNAGQLSKMPLTQKLKKPVAIAIDEQDNLYILEYEEKQVLKFNSQGTFEGTAPSNQMDDLEPSSLAIDRLGNIYIGNKSTSGTPYVIDSSGKATPMMYQGAVYRLISNDKGDLYMLGENEIVFLRLAERYISRGICITKPFDSTVPECRWHKMLVEADIPTNTRMSVYHYISNKNVLPDEPAWSEPVINFEDALILSEKGQYIWFKIELLSDDLNLAGPKIKSLKVYFPRLSYLRYLPATYQENEASREFLERFLSLFETFFSNIDESITTLTRYIDSEATPEAFLPWLSSWLAIAYDENWEAERVRRLIGKAPELYRKRGTRAVIEQLIEIFSGEKPIILENFLLKFMTDKAAEGKLIRKANQGESKLLLKEAKIFQPEDVIKISQAAQEELAIIDYIKTDTLNLRGKLRAGYDIGAVVKKVRIEEILYGDSPYRFHVLLKPAQVKTASELNTVRRLVELEKPAHTIGGVRSLLPWFYLDLHTYLEINTALTEPVFVLGESSVISRDTFLSELEDSGQIDLRARLAIDTKLT
jgi:phage tail-like protein